VSIRVGIKKSAARLARVGARAAGTVPAGIGMSRHPGNQAMQARIRSGVPGPSGAPLYDNATMQRMLRRNREAAPTRGGSGAHIADGGGITRDWRGHALTLGRPGDRFERQADQLAERALTAGAPLGAEVGGPQPRLSASRAEPSPPGRDALVALDGADRATNEAGRPLPPELRRDMERRLGQRFGGVRVHTGELAAWSARALGADAYALGEHLVFGGGRFEPSTRAGRRLIAHELAHTMQGGRGDRVVRRSTGDGGETAPGLLTGVAPAGGSGRPPPPERCPPPLVMGCEEAIDSVDHQYEAHFDVGSAALRPPDPALLDSIAAFWRFVPQGFGVRVDGFASAEGDCITNWTLSCARANAVVARLSAPSGGLGIDPADIVHFAGGESDAAGPSLEANRRATLRLEFRSATTPSPAPTPAPTPSPTPTPATPGGCAPGALRSVPNCTPNPNGAHLPPVGATHTETHALMPCLLTQAQVAASPDWCVDAQQAHGGEVCYRQIPAVNGGPGDQYCYTANGCCHNSPDAVSVVSATSPGSNACCATNRGALPGHVWEDVVPEFLDDPIRVGRDILGL